jgi:hypothetical protein
MSLQINADGRENRPSTSGCALKEVPWGALEKAPFVVVSRLFGITKLRSLQLDWRFFRQNRADKKMY